MTTSTLSWTSHPRPALVRLAWPIAVSMVSFSVMTLVDTLLMGHLGRSELAGVGLAGTVAFFVLCFSIGLLQGAKVLVSQATGAGRDAEARAFAAAAIWAGAGLGVITIALGQVVAAHMSLFTATPTAGHAAETYLAIRLLGAPLVLIQVALREVRYARGDSRSPMRATIVANVVNAALASVLVLAFDWGVKGAACATLVACAIEASMLVAIQKADGGLGLARARWPHFTALVRMGIPTATQLLLEVGSFVLLTLMLSRFSEVDMAAHQIALQVIHFSFLPALAVGEAVSVLAGQAVGADRDDLVVRVSRIGLGIVVVHTAVCALISALGGGVLVRFFTTDPAVIEKGIRLLQIAAIFQIADGAYVVARGGLRGAGDVRYAAIVGVLATWMSVPPLTWLLGYRLGLGAIGGWIGFCGEIFIGGALVWLRLERKGFYAAARRSRAELVRTAVAPARSPEPTPLSSSAA